MGFFKVRTSSYSCKRQSFYLKLKHIPFGGVKISKRKPPPHRPEHLMKRRGLLLILRVDCIMQIKVLAILDHEA